jgi:hypothetical protein
MLRFGIVMLFVVLTAGVALADKSTYEERQRQMRMVYDIADLSMYLRLATITLKPGQS